MGAGSSAAASKGRRHAPSSGTSALTQTSALPAPHTSKDAVRMQDLEAQVRELTARPAAASSRSPPHFSADASASSPPPVTPPRRQPHYPRARSNRRRPPREIRHRLLRRAGAPAHDARNCDATGSSSPRAVTIGCAALQRSSAPHFAARCSAAFGSCRASAACPPSQCSTRSSCGRFALRLVRHRSPFTAVPSHRCRTPRPLPRCMHAPQRRPPRPCPHETRVRAPQRHGRRPVQCSARGRTERGPRSRAVDQRRRVRGQPVPPQTELE